MAKSKSNINKQKSTKKAGKPKLVNLLRNEVTQHEKILNAKQLIVNAEQARKKKPKIKPPRYLYSEKDEILLVGEGNCSFSRSLVDKFGVGDKITCTTFDTHDLLKKKYGEEVDDHIATLLDANARVFHGVDATKLHEFKAFIREGEKTALFDTIVFNFPHTGSGIKNTARNIMANQEMLSEFFKSAYQVLAEKGEIHVTVKVGEPYAQWRVTKLAQQCTDLYVKNAENFDPNIYTGYEHRRTIGFDEIKSKAANFDIEKGARTYVLIRDTDRRIREQKEKEHPKNHKRARKEDRKATHKRTYRQDSDDDSDDNSHQDNDIRAPVNLFEKVKFSDFELA
eukprot:CFRG2049T1